MRGYQRRYWRPRSDEKYDKILESVQVRNSLINVKPSMSEDGRKEPTAKHIRCISAEDTSLKLV